MTSVACIHGVNTGARYPFAEEWLAALSSAGALVRDVTSIRWRSHDDGIRDWAGLRLRRSFREGAALDVEDGIADWLMRTAGPRVVVAHSAGTLLALEVRRRLRERSVMGWGLVLLASPLTHPVLGLQARAMGFGPALAAGVGVPAYASREDPITCLPLLPPLASKPLDVRWVDVPDAIGPEEHAAERYLAIPDVARAVMHEARVPFGTR